MAGERRTIWSVPTPPGGHGGGAVITPSPEAPHISALPAPPGVSAFRESVRLEDLKHTKAPWHWKRIPLKAEMEMEFLGWQNHLQPFRPHLVKLFEWMVAHQVSSFTQEDVQRVHKLALTQYTAQVAVIHTDILRVGPYQLPHPLGETWVRFSAKKHALIPPFPCPTSHLLGRTAVDLQIEPTEEEDVTLSLS